jgi:hypothetical protein
MVVVCPTPIGLGSAVTYAKVGMFHVGVCADAIGSAASVAPIEITNRMLIARAVVLGLKFRIFLVLSIKVGAGLRHGTSYKLGSKFLVQHASCNYKAAVKFLHIKNSNNSRFWFENDMFVNIFTFFV